ncbi:DUF3311 domain-containing protein [Planctomycetaceae bacterium SH139]
MTDISSNPSSTTSGNGKWVIALLVLLLLVLHQDNWFWEDGTLVFGFLPIGLFYHACISLAAALVWFIATRIAWPVETIAHTIAQVKIEQNSEEASQ